MLKTNTFNDSRKELKRNQLCGVKYLASGGSGYVADWGTPPVPVADPGFQVRGGVHFYRFFLISIDIFIVYQYFPPHFNAFMHIKSLEFFCKQRAKRAGFF